MSVNAHELKQIVQVLDPALQGSIIRRVYAPETDSTLILTLRLPGQNTYLILRFAQNACCIGRSADKPKSSATPNPFVMLLRKHLEGTRITSVRQHDGDRVVTIACAGHEGPISLICEITDRLANVFVIDAQERILGSFHPNRSHRRQLVPGARYVPPEPPPLLHRPAVIRIPEGPDADMAYERLYRDWQQTHDQQQRILHLRHRLLRVRQKKAKLQARLEADWNRARQADELRRWAHVLQAHLGNVKKGQTVLRTRDFEDNRIEIPLSPERSPVDNMQRLFHRAGRLAAASPAIEQRHHKIEADIARLDQWLKALETHPETVDMEEISTWLQPTTRALPGRDTIKPGNVRRLPYRQFPIAGGHLARVGRSAADNDTLTLHHAAPMDLWLHVRGQSGSHVVVPLGRGEEPSSEVLIDAAHLAAHFSSGHQQDAMEITWTRRRYVQKRKGSARGAVQLLQERTFMLRVDRDRLERLLAHGSGTVGA